MRTIQGLLPAIVLLFSARAQDSETVPRPAAFLSSLKGDVSVVSAAGARVTEATAGARLSVGDRVVTGSWSRADIRLESGDVFHAGANTEVLLELADNGHYVSQLAQGTLDYRVTAPSTAHIEVHTPSVTVRPSQPGVYRMTVKGNGESEIASRAGWLEVYGPGGAQWLEPGQKMVARGSPSNPEFRILNGSRWKRILVGLAQMAGNISFSAGGGEQASNQEEKPTARAQPASSAARSNESHAGKAPEPASGKSSGGSVHESARTAGQSAGAGGSKSPDPPAKSK
jgi:hypothetical protein